MKGQAFPEKKIARADLDSLRKIFTAPEGPSSTLAKVEREISANLMGFLKKHIAAGDMDPAHLEADFQETMIPEEPMFVSEEAKFLLEKVVDQSVHVSSPSFVGHMTSAIPYFMLPLAKIMIALNQNLVKIETSKAFTPLERQVIGMLHRLVYKRDNEYYRTNLHNHEIALGTFSSDGTLANITAMWVARNVFLDKTANFKGVAQEGLARALRYYGYEGLAILVSKRGHYSLTKAADLLGLGRKFLIDVETTSENKINLDSLTREIAHLHEANIKPLAIVGIAGTTETGNVDPLDKLANIASETGCHFHVDAAWGGPTLFSNRYQGLLSGIERSDSLSIDCHKQLYVPIGSAITLFKKETAVRAIEHSAQYVVRKGSRDLGKFTLEGSRPGMAMLVHSALRVFGQKGFEILIDIGIGKAKQFAKTIQAAEDFELISEPELNLLTYRYLPPLVKNRLKNGPPEVVQKINDLISEMLIDLQRVQRARGKTFVSRTRFEVAKYNNQPLVVFRVVTANPLTTRQILASILDEQREIAAELLKADYNNKLETLL